MARVWQLSLRTCSERWVMEGSRSVWLREREPTQTDNTGRVRATALQAKGLGEGKRKVQKETKGSDVWDEYV